VTRNEYLIYTSTTVARVLNTLTHSKRPLGCSYGVHMDSPEWQTLSYQWPMTKLDLKF
jgi:hypothetical protein